MINEIMPSYVALIFGATTLLTLLLFYLAIQKAIGAAKAKQIGLGLVAWLVLQMLLSINLIYLDTIGNMPPLFPLTGFLPLLLLMIFLFSSNAGKIFIDRLPLFDLTLLSVVRIPVEIVLWLLFVYHTIPEAMTFEGRNFDILAGITAPLIAYFGFKNGTINRQLLLGWNIIGLLLLLNIIFHAVLSFPSFMQQMAFDQPNVGLLYFPFIWLPSFVAPVVLFGHLASIRQLWKNN